MTDPGPNPFDALFALMTPARLLADPRATGEGVAVAVVDSGVDRTLLQSRAKSRGHDLRAIPGVRFRPGVAPEPENGPPSSPHGTTVADVILSVAPRVSLFSADVFGPQGCDVDTVVAALRHAMDVWNVKVVNLSLGVPEAKLQLVAKRQLLQRTIEEAYHRDVLVFAAAHNDHPISKSYPAAFAPPLVSVDKGVFDDPLRFQYRPRETVEFLAHGRGYLGPFAREPATSWATPHLTGVAARLLSLRPELKPFELKTLLYWLGREAG